MLDRKLLLEFLRGLAPAPNGPRGLYAVIGDLRGPAPAPPDAPPADPFGWAVGAASPARVADGLLAAATDAAERATAWALLPPLRRARAALRAGRDDEIADVVRSLTPYAEEAAARRSAGMSRVALAHYHAVDAAWSAVAFSMARQPHLGRHALAAAGLAGASADAPGGAAVSAFLAAVTGV